MINFYVCGHVLSFKAYIVGGQIFILIFALIGPSLWELFSDQVNKLQKNVCPILKIISSVIAISNTCVTFTELKICCPAHLYSRSYVLVMMWEIEICWWRFLHWLHMVCLIKNWKYFYPLTPPPSSILPDFVKSVSPSDMSKYSLIGPVWKSSICAYEQCSKPYFGIFINIISIEFHICWKAHSWFFSQFQFLSSWEKWEIFLLFKDICQGLYSERGTVILKKCGLWCPISKCWVLSLLLSVDGADPISLWLNILISFLVSILLLRTLSVYSFAW